MPDESITIPPPPAPEPSATTTPEPVPDHPPTPSLVKEGEEVVPSIATTTPESASIEVSADKTADVTPPVPVISGSVRSLLDKALAKIQFRKKAKLEKIMVLAKSKGQVTNDDAQALLRVSDATATRYLAALAKAGRLQPTGIRGGAVYRFVQ